MQETNPTEQISFALYCYIRDKNVGNEAEIGIQFVFNHTIGRFQWNEHLKAQYHLDKNGALILINEWINDLIKTLQIV